MVEAKYKFFTKIYILHLLILRPGNFQRNFLGVKYDVIHTHLKILFSALTSNAFSNALEVKL